MPAPKKTKNQPPATVQNFPIVGIGASAGGLDAFKRLLTAIPEDSGMAYVLVQHLDPTHESFLPEILQRVTKIPVYEITEDIHLAPNHIYIIPSNKILTSTDGVLQLSPRDKKTLNFTIDIFFTSIADVHKECAVGIVLSGTGSDGTLGLKAIKENGGISIAQDIDTATYDSMPLSAIAAGVVDFILSPEEIPAQLLQINNTYKSGHAFKNDEEQLPKDGDVIFKQIILLLRQRSGVDFSFYKQPTIHRRIARRIAIGKNKNLADYLKFLRTDKAEQDALFQDVLIPVTSFFRDPQTFDALIETVFPSIVKNKTNDDTIRIWIAGCSTGEEAFSIAISLHTFLRENSFNTKIQIFATDISEKAIKKARASIYTKTDVATLSATQLKNYFIKNNGGYEVNKLLRDMCVFAPHNFLKDPPFAKMDLITCRNVLIYMNTFLQKKAFATFHYALKENGYLLLGKSETIGTSSDLFTQASKQEKIYTRKPVPGRFVHIATERREESMVATNKTASKQETIHTDFRKSAEAIMISKSPASVVVNEQMDIVHIHGDITPFLQQPQGKPSHNLMKMAREGLAFELRNAIHKAKASEETVIKEGIPVKSSGAPFLVSLNITPLTSNIELHYLIQFEKKGIPQEVDEKGNSSENDKSAHKRYAALEKELSQTREDMRAITEDMQAANEELQSANEELQSSNEEMQSLNEELETSREELQSTNEELIIVNQELNEKQFELNTTRHYAESIVSTIREPLIVLDKKLRIKTANASFYKKFNTTEEETEGELFYEIQKGQWDDNEMRSLLEKILPKHERLSDFEIIMKFPVLGERHLLMNALQIKNDKTAEQLILLAIEDITERKIAEQKLEITAIELAETNKLVAASENRFRSVLEEAPDGIVVINEQRKIQMVNVQTEKLFGFKREEIIGKELDLLIPDRFRTIHVENEKEFMADPKPRAMGVGKELFAKRKDGSEFPIVISLSPLQREDGNPIILATIRDITEQKRISTELIEAKTNAETATEIAEHAVMAKQQFLSNMSHEIRTPMNAIIGFTKVLTKTVLTEKQKEYLEAIKSSGDTLIVLINDILDLAKVDAGKMIFVNSPFKISHSITTILHLFEPKIEEMNLEVVKEYDARIPEVLLGDSIRLHQILINLLSNAIKFTAKGKIIVSVNLISEDDEKVKLEIKITDTGIGIPKNKIDSVFENFEQAHAITSSLYGGTGLGLAIVKQLVEKQGGTIAVKSKVGEGSTFSFTLNLLKTDLEVAHEIGAEQYETKNKPLKVLVVEDVKLNQLLLRTILDDFKFEWDMADNGKIAIEKLQTKQYDIILMDLQMPIMNGFEATEHIRNKMKLQIPIIALTADVTTVDVEKCKAIGMNDYISKPLDEKLLYSKIIDLVNAI